MALLIALVVFLASPPWIVFALEPFRDPHSVVYVSSLFIWGVGVLVATIAAIFDPSGWTEVTRRGATFERLFGIGIILATYAVLIGTFAAFYFQLAHVHPGTFNVKLAHHAQAVYFTIGTFTTTGYGDIHPTQTVSQLVVSAQMIVALALIAMVVSALTSRLLDSLARQHSS